MPPPRAVVFDLDGTLVDTFAISLQATQHVLRQFLPGPVPDSEVIPLFGVPLPEIMARYAPQRVEAMVAAFESYYLAHQEALVRPFAGVIEALEALLNWGYPLGVLSNKRKEPGLREIRICGLTGLFQSVLLLEDLAAPKPAPEALRQSAQALGVPPEDVLYVGDSVLDIQCARLAGARSAAALWRDGDGSTRLTTSGSTGLTTSGSAGPAGSREQLLALKPDHALSSVEELLALCRPW